MPSRSDLAALHAHDVSGLRLGLAVAAFPSTLGEMDAPGLEPWLSLDAPAPLQRDDEARGAVRDLLRREGYKPTGRGKPASEYLVGAAQAGRLAPINVAVDVCNAVSLHSGLPISVVDLDRTQGDLRVGTGGPDDAYVFNASGQKIRLGGLLCLADALGPCATPVRDGQRTKTHGGTRRTLYLIWSPASESARLAAAHDWLLELLRQTGAEVPAG